ncbi:helix-turn-helix transcriptional regulator [Lachnospiraceae bacterium 48-42]|nr:helix-turn-helix transcriptional regulator [Dorea sp.]
MKVTHEEFNSLIGRKIKRIRQERNYTREGLAEAAGISSRFLYEIEMGRKGCSAFVLFRLASNLRVNVNYFMQEEKDIFWMEFQRLYMRFEEDEKKELNEIMKILHEMLHKV